MASSDTPVPAIAQGLAAASPPLPRLRCSRRRFADIQGFRKNSEAVSSSGSNGEDDMTQTAIFGPFFATILLTLVVWVYMYARRIRFITGNRINSQDLAVPGALAQLSPPAVSNPSDNLKNLFEIPVIFYALALYLFVTNQVDALYVDAAWIFVVFRALHSAVHCTVNIVMLRFYLYLIATLAVWFIALRAVLMYMAIDA
jgi:hypothetical protein